MSNFTLQIKHKDQILRESRNKEIFLPFNLEYSILIKNENDRRAKVSVTIDGTDILGNNQIVIEPFKTLELDRFMIDGALDSGRKLLFVRKDDSRVQDPSSEENGNIVVQCWLEKEKRVIEHHHHYHYHNTPMVYGFPYVTTGTSSSGGMRECTASWNSNVKSCNFLRGVENTKSCNDAGATVESDNFSDMKFKYSTENIEYEDSCTTLSLTLKSCVCHNKPVEHGIESKKRMLELWDQGIISDQCLCEKLGLRFDLKKNRMVIE